MQHVEKCQMRIFVSAVRLDFDRRLMLQYREKNCWRILGVSARERARWAPAVSLSLALLLAPALWNGFPLLQYDSGGYLARWYEGTWCRAGPWSTA